MKVPAWLSKPGLVRTALVLWGLFILASVAGLRKYVSVLSFTPVDGEAIGLLDTFLMLTYVLLYAAATTVAPICLLAKGLEVALGRFIKKTPGTADAS